MYNAPACKECTVGSSWQTRTSCRVAQCNLLPAHFCEVIITPGPGEPVHHRQSVVVPGTMQVQPSRVEQGRFGNGPGSPDAMDDCADLPPDDGDVVKEVRDDQQGGHKPKPGEPGLTALVLLEIPKFHLFKISTDSPLVHQLVVWPSPFQQRVQILDGSPSWGNPCPNFPYL